MMRRVLVLAMSLAAGPATAREVGAGAGEPLDLAEVNRALRGRRASLELAGGSTVMHARRVSVAADVTAWRGEGQEQRVPTSDVLRITVEPKGRILSGLGWGLAAGAGVGVLAVGTSSDTDTSLDPAADASVLAGSVILGGVVGTIVGLVRGREPARVVYQVQAQAPAD